jgi:hypothetical protein
MPTPPTYEQFRDEWLVDVQLNNPSTIELGNRFAQKLVTQWRDLDSESADIYYCDGSGDGGIDVALLVRGESAADGDAPEGDTWYLVQSKYGSAFQGVNTLFVEGRKVIETLDGRTPRLSSIAGGLLARITAFRESASPLDRLILLYATQEPLTEAERRAMTDVRSMGRERLGAFFDVESISIETVYLRTLDEANNVDVIRVPLRAEVSSASEDLLIGAVSLTNLYAFLKGYRETTDDLDRIYEKNVRRFLGGRGKVNKRIQQTLQDEPERFGLYNNGITIVVADFQRDGAEVELCDPYIVNGCQTTRTIWEVCQAKLDAGGTGTNAALNSWRGKAERGVVVTKIAKVGTGGETLLQEITRFTNSQNAVREKDFLALSGDLRSWAAEMASRYDVYLEIQRGGWDSQRAWQKQHPNGHHFARSANAFDLIKVYGAGWLGEAGIAFGKNPPFLPGGAVFKRITENPELTGGFDADDLFAAHLLQDAADDLKFGRVAEKASRRQTRFLFYMIVLDLLRDVMVRSGLPVNARSLTDGILKVFGRHNELARTELLAASIDALDEYMTDGTEDSVFAEPSFRSDFNSDLNAFLKAEQLGKSEQSTPRFRSLLAGTKRTLGRSRAGHPSPREIIASVIMI